MAQSYKTLKEDFVSNLTGGKISDINYVTAVAPVCAQLYHIVLNETNTSNHRLLFSCGLRFSHVVDFLSVMVWQHSSRTSCLTLARYYLQ